MKGEQEQPSNGIATSVVSYPERNPRWGSSQFRGNCDGQLIWDLIRHYGGTRIFDPMEGSGTTADVVRDLAQKYPQADYCYWGNDLSNGFDAIEDRPPVGPFDFVWLHPPYYDMIVYSDNPRDLSQHFRYEEFLEALFVVFNKCLGHLAPGGHLAVLLGDRRKNGRYYPIASDLVAAVTSHLDLRPCSIIVKVQQNVSSNRRRHSHLSHPRIMHEYCVVYHR